MGLHYVGVAGPKNDMEVFWLRGQFVELGFTHQESVTNSDNHQWGIYNLQLSSSQH